MFEKDLVLDEMVLYASFVNVDYNISKVSNKLMGVVSQHKKIESCTIDLIA